MNVPSLAALGFALTLILFTASPAHAQEFEKPISWVNPKIPSIPGLSHHLLESDALGHDVGYAVWTPPAYHDQPETRFPVVYFLHGMGGHESADAGGFASLLGQAIARGWSPPVIAVFPNGGRSGYRNEVEAMIRKELIPHIDATYRTIDHVSARGVAGFSMGGAGAIWLSLNYPTVFGFAASWGGALWRMEEEALAAVDRDHERLQTSGFSALLINGEHDRPDGFAPLIEQFSNHAIPHRVVVLENTKHNLGHYYERSGETMARFIGARLRSAHVTHHEKVDLLIAGGRVIDGTGAPWYVADIAIKDGKIARIGQLEGVPASKRIDAEGLVVAPGFIDMMGQTASPMLGDADTALNLLTQGVTTINAGEGYSAAPLTGDDASSEGWQTMAEYFQILDLRGLPVNVAQTVGHTQVRRLVMGEVDCNPNEEELAQMKAHVREAMEAGAIGLSTALIYPPAVYADTDEIGALAAVAGEYGGRYFTHMRNEGDQLLEAIDEALEIGRKGGTPVHIFHLKAAGQGNWPKMAQAIAKIKAARAAGQEVTADIYPYINNGLGIEALVHPRHFANGRDAFLTKVEDPAIRATIRREMETDGGGWENWFKHMGRDWDRLVVGRAFSPRYMDQSGKSLGLMAEDLKMDPWDLFFQLVKTGAFVLPETMSRENKKRLIREEFVSFCTDVGPAGGSGIASHPRAYGSFPRLMARYIRDDETISLERAIAQATAVAANAILTRDRGRLAEGLAADIILFDYQKLIDHADFANPHAHSEGVRHVLVNGELVLEDGKLLERSRPGRVLRGPGYRPEAAAWNVSTGQIVPELASVDTYIRTFLRKHRSPSISVSITDAGRLVYARAFGYADVAAREQAMPESLYRIASITKPITATAIFHLIENGKLSLDDKIFDLLDGYEPPTEDAEIDPRLAEITVRHCLQHTGGWDRNKSFDAMFRSVDFAKALGVPSPADPDAVIRNMLAQPLDFDPGSQQSYSNFGYSLLGRVIAKLSGTDYETYVQQHVLSPISARTMTLGHSLKASRKAGEVLYYSPFRGPSVFADTLGKRVPYPYGGWHLEAMDSHGAWIASSIDLARFAAAFDGDAPLLSKQSLETMFAPAESTGWPHRYTAGWARWETDHGPIFSHSGSLAGTSTLLVKRPDGRNWVVLINTRTSPHTFSPATAMMSGMNAVLDTIEPWPAHDLFTHFQE